MGCYEEIRKIGQRSYAFDPKEFDAVIKKYGSEAYISSAVWSALHGFNANAIKMLVDHAAELIDWDNPPEPLVGLLSVIDHEGALQTGDPAACHDLCRTITQINNVPYRIALIAVFAYYLD